VTIPKEIRDELGLKPSDKIEFFIENGHTRLQKAYLTLEVVEGSLPGLGADIDLERAIVLAKEDRARKVVEKLKSV
jgi:AbrB family looped-hinge helix DNA binding protein